LFKNYLDWFTISYEDDDYFIKRKAEYAATLIHGLILSVIIVMAIEIAMVGYTAYNLISTVAVFILFGSILMLIRNNRLDSGINLLIIGGFLRLLMIYFYPTPFQFYVLAMVNIVIIAVIHTKISQVRVISIGVLFMMMAKIPVYYFMVLKNEIHWRAITQSIYSVVFYAIFIMMIEFLVKIINEEINKTQLLQTRAFTDHLTGLRNRRAFWEIESNKNLEGNIYSIILLDVDHFKRINDTLGHHIGDQVLIQLAKVIAGEVEYRGCVYRWGGEEFLVHLPNVEKKEALELGEKIRHTVESSNFIVGNNVTVSLGVEEGYCKTNLEDVISRADQAMYLAKESGRNQICELKAIS